MPTVAVMQPYFVPYAGYFRLFAEADLVALFDCVQFPRRGWVHRNRLKNAQGELAWLSLPLDKNDFHARICDMRLVADIRARLEVQFRRFPSLASADPDHPILSEILTPQPDLVGYLERTLAVCCEALGIPFNVVRTSTMNVSPQLKGKDRIIEIVSRLGGSVYLNPPGGTHLYSHAEFEEAGLSLTFLPQFEGDSSSILQRLLSEPADTVRAEIVRKGLPA